MALWLCACGERSGNQLDLSAESPDRGTARALSLSDALLELDSLAVPDGVQQADFAGLQAELARVLKAQNTDRFISAAPQSAGSAVNDLIITHNPDGSADLSWTYRNQGDGDLNSEVNIADLTPLGIHLGKNSASADWNRARNTDNDRNEEVNISDITPIGSNFFNKVDGYWLQRAVAIDSTWNLVTQIPFDTSTQNADTAQREFTHHLSVPADGNFYRVAPYQGGETGIPSNAVQAESFVLPGRPGNVSATQGTLFGSVELSWAGVVDVEFYEIQRRPGTLGAFEHLADTADSTTGYIDSDVASGTHYTYIVRGWQGDKKTDFSIQFEGWPLEVPPSPANLQASDGTSDLHVSVSWEAAERTDEYVVYHSLDENGTYTEIARTDQLAYDDTAATPAVLNWYYVTAVNQAGESAESNRDGGYLEGALPNILSVAPLGSPTGTTIEMTSVIQGATPLSWDWNFGLAATPSTSTDEHPMITLGEPGVYDCSLTVEGTFSNQTFDFQMTVTQDEWVHSFGTAAADDGFNVGADSDGNVYVIGRAGIPVIAKFNLTGELQWARQYQTDLDYTWISGSVSPAGEVFMATALDSADPSEGKGVLNVKLDTDGNLVFAKVFSLGDSLILSRFPRTAFNPTGKIYVCYTSYSLVDIAGMLVAYRLTANGGIEWQKSYETPSDYPHDESLADGIAVDSLGNLYVGADEANVTKIDTSGNVLWCKGWGDVAATPHEHAYTMGVDSDDNIYLAGGANDLDDYQPFLVKFDQSGTILWQKAFSSGAGTTSAQIVRMTVDANGNVYALNPQRGDPGEPSAFFMLNANGNPLGAWEYTTTGSTKIYDVNYFNGRVQFCGSAPDPDGVWSTANNSLSDYSLAIEDRVATQNALIATLLDDSLGELQDYTGDLDNGEGSTDVLVMNLRTDNLLP